MQMVEEQWIRPAPDPTGKNSERHVKQTSESEKNDFLITTQDKK